MSVWSIFPCKCCIAQVTSVRFDDWRGINVNSLRSSLYRMTKLIETCIIINVFVILVQFGYTSLHIPAHFLHILYILAQFCEILHILHIFAHFLHILAHFCTLCTFLQISRHLHILAHFCTFPHIFALLAHSCTYLHIFFSF